MNSPHTGKPMQNHYKTIKHKTLPGVFAYPADMPIELSHVSTPMLMDNSVDMEFLKKYYKDHPLALKQLDDYEVVDVFTLVGISAIDVAAGLFNIHHHDLEGDIIYKESELLPLLKSWGLPEPDWKGNAKRDELELLSRPGDTIKETMEEMGIDKQIFSMNLVVRMPGITRGDIDGLFDGDTVITPEIANALQAILNIDAQFWLNREANYRAKLSKL